MIKLNVEKKYDNQHEFHYELDIDKGSMICIQGKSGSGKTTLLNILGLIDPRFKGEYYFSIDDTTYNIHEMKQKNRKKIRSKEIGFVFQDNNLLEYLNVYENITLPFSFQKKEINSEEIDEIMTYLGIDSLKQRNVTTLSGGEKQRVAIARCLALKNHLLLADEPTGSLDEYNADIVMNLFKEINEKYHITIVLVTHSTRYNHLFQKCYMIEEGKLCLH